jgi:hypothetical protein
MTSIWSESDSGWELLAPTGFPDEKTLQDLVERAPGMLPLGGAPTVVVLGREVRLGSGYVDVLAIEPSGRPVLIEVKLRNNAESRRAVVSQVLAYAAAVHGTTAAEFEQNLSKHLNGRQLHDVVRDAAQAEAPEAAEFYATLDSTLQDGDVRVVLVLDHAPQDLIKLVGYLEAVTHGLSIDLITVTSYQVADRMVVVPQRQEPDRPARLEPTTPTSRALPAQTTGKVRGLDAFAERVETAPAIHRPTLDLFVDWAKRVSDADLADMHTYFGKNDETVLLPYVPPEEVGLVSLYMRADGRPALQSWRSVFERRAPASIAAVEAAAGTPMGKGTMATTLTPALLDAVFSAYVEAASSRT